MNTLTEYKLRARYILNHYDRNSEMDISVLAQVLRGGEISAFKEGMMNAAEVCMGNNDWLPADNEECADAIRSAANKLIPRDG